jgi:hypothetical protein
MLNCRKPKQTETNASEEINFRILRHIIQSNH